MENKCFLKVIVLVFVFVLSGVSCVPMGPMAELKVEKYHIEVSGEGNVVNVKSENDQLQSDSPSVEKTESPLKKAGMVKSLIQKIIPGK